MSIPVSVIFQSTKAKASFQFTEQRQQSRW